MDELSKLVAQWVSNSVQRRECAHRAAGITHTATPPAGAAWREMRPNNPWPLPNSGVATCAGNIFAFSGKKNSELTNQLLRMDKVDDEYVWTNIPVPSRGGVTPVVGSTCSVVSVGGRLVIFGRNCGEGSDFCTLYVWTRETDEWEQLNVAEGVIPAGLRDYSVVAQKENTQRNSVVDKNDDPFTLFLFGGVNCDDGKEPFYFHDNMWSLTVLPGLKKGLHWIDHCGDGQSEGQYDTSAVPGRRGAGKSGTEERPAKRAGHSSVLWKSEIYIYAGSNGTDIFGDLWGYNTSKLTWRKASASAGVVPPPRYGHTAALMRDRMIVFGGRTAAELCNTDLLELSIPSMTWFEIRPAAPSPAPRFRHSCSALDGRVLFVLGGRGSQDAHGDAFFVSLDVPTPSRKNLDPAVSRAGGGQYDVQAYVQKFVDCYREVCFQLRAKEEEIRGLKYTIRIQEDKLQEYKRRTQELVEKNNTYKRQVQYLLEHQQHQTAKLAGSGGAHGRRAPVSDVSALLLLLQRHQQQQQQGEAMGGGVVSSVKSTAAPPASCSSSSSSSSPMSSALSSLWSSCSPCGSVLQSLVEGKDGRLFSSVGGGTGNSATASSSTAITLPPPGFAPISHTQSSSSFFPTPQVDRRPTPEVDEVEEIEWNIPEGVDAEDEEATPLWV